MFLQSALQRCLQAKSLILFSPIFQQKYWDWLTRGRSCWPGWCSCSQSTQFCCDLHHLASTELELSKRCPLMLADVEYIFVPDLIPTYLKIAILNHSENPYPFGKYSCWWRLTYRRSWGICSGVNLGYFSAKLPLWWASYWDCTHWEVVPFRTSPKPSSLLLLLPSPFPLISQLFW